MISSRFIRGGVTFGSGTLCTILDISLNPASLYRHSSRFGFLKSISPRTYLGSPKKCSPCGLKAEDVDVSLDLEACFLVLCELALDKLRLPAILYVSFFASDV